MPVISRLAAAALATAAGAALAQPASPDQSPVAVAIGPELQKKAQDLGARELADLQGDLRDMVQRALARAKGARPVRVDLVIEDAVPNRPTFEQLGRTPGLSIRSVGVGGARVSGTATYADGGRRPIREQYYETDIRDVHGLSTWYDADIAFERVAYDLKKGKLPDRFEGPGPGSSGHFGFPFTDR